MRTSRENDNAALTFLQNSFAFVCSANYLKSPVNARVVPANQQLYAQVPHDRRCSMWNHSTASAQCLSAAVLDEPSPCAIGGIYCPVIVIIASSTTGGQEVCATLRRLLMNACEDRICGVMSKINYEVLQHHQHQRRRAQSTSNRLHTQSPRLLSLRTRARLIISIDYMRVVQTSYGS